MIQIALLFKCHYFEHSKNPRHVHLAATYPKRNIHSTPSQTSHDNHNQTRNRLRCLLGVALGRAAPCPLQEFAGLSAAPNIPSRVSNQSTYRRTNLKAARSGEKSAGVAAALHAISPLLFAISTLPRCSLRSHTIKTARTFFPLNPHCVLSSLLLVDFAASFFAGWA